MRHRSHNGGAVCAIAYDVEEFPHRIPEVAQIFDRPGVQRSEVSYRHAACLSQPLLKFPHFRCGDPLW